MSNPSIISNNTLSTKDKDRHTIPFRIDFIRKLLEKNELKPMVNFDNTETENYMTKRDEDDSDSQKSFDTRMSLSKKIYDFVTVINQLGGQLEYIKSGTTGHTFKGKIVNSNGDETNFGVKVVAYPKKEKYGNIYDARRPENAELMMIKLLSYFVVKKQTPHIVLPIGTFNTSIKNFVNLIEENVVDKEEHQRYVEFVKKYNNNEYYDDVSILISEWANKGDLLDFLRKNYKQCKLIHWKVFFFQIISTLAVVQSKFPSFRHNDLKANNILVQKIDKNMKNKFIYRVERHYYTVPNIGYFVKMWDFDFACVPGIVDNSKVSSEWTKAINVIPEQNRYYDMHYFFNTLIKKGFFPQFMTDECIPKEAQEFVNRIVPDKYKEGKYVHKRGRILINDEYLTPDAVLKTDPFFEIFRKTNNEPQTPAKQTGSGTNDKPIKKQTSKKSGSKKKQEPKKKTKKNDMNMDEIDNIKLEDLLG